MKGIQKGTSKTCRIEDKGSRFVALDSDSYIENTDRQLERSCFQQLDYNPSDEFCKRIMSRVKKLKQTKFLTTVGADLLGLPTRIQVKCTV